MEHRGVGLNKLRFTEYTEPWEQKKLGEVADFHMGFTPSTKKEEYWSGNNHWLNVKGLGKSKYIQQGNKMISDEAIRGKKVFEPGTLLMSFKLSLGELGITQIPLFTNEAICGFTPQPVLSTEYLYYVLNGTNLKNYAQRAVMGYTMNNSSIKTVDAPLPSLAEQEKIGGFLSALDERLRIQSELVDLLALEYTGYSQRIFNQTLRFKDEDGNNYPDWEQKKLGDLIESGGSGGTPTSSNKDYYGGEYPFLSISDITKQGKYVTETKSSLTQKGIDNSGAWVVPTGSLIYAMYASVGKLCINNYPVTTSQALYAMKLKDEVNTNYIYSALERVNVEQLNRVIMQGTQKNINAKTLKNFDIPLPSLPEQEKIGGFLSALSARIETERALLAQYKEQKKAYLQKLLP